MTRIAIAVPRRRPCGIADVALRLARSLPDHWEPVLVELPDGAGRAAWRRTARRMCDADVAHVHYEYGLFHVVKPLRNRLATLLGPIRDRVVLSLHQPLPALEPRWPRRRSAADLVRDLAYLPFFRSWEATQYRRATHVVAYCGPVRDSAARFVPPGRLSQLPLPVPTATATWSGGPEGAAVVLVTPGFVKPHKGYELMVEILQRRPDWSWVIAGGPQTSRDRRSLAELVRDLGTAGVSDRVEFVGTASERDIEQRIAAASVAVLPFLHTNASASLAWAVACGTPVVATDLPAIAEVAAAGAGVELVTGRDPDRWSEAIGRIVAAPDRLDALAGASRRYASAHDDAAVAAAHAAIFADVAGSAGR